MSRLMRQGPAPKPGIVHLGLGAFFRAFGAIYVEDAMAAAGGDWGIVGVSLKSTTMRDQLVPQGCVYTAVELGPDGATDRVVTSVCDVLHAPSDAQVVLDAIETAKIVTLTVTEKGYCHTPATGALNRDHPDIRHDLAHPNAPCSAIGFIVAGLNQRRLTGRAAFTVMCCDNMPSNGQILERLVLEFAQALDPGLADWIRNNVVFPSTMVDRIVPATTKDDLVSVAARTGVDDAAPVMHEPFRQWVIEDRFVNNDRPDLAAVGAQLVDDVTPFEHMKLRMLNGSHSALAYIGYLSGHETISQCVQDPVLRDFVRNLWATEIIPTLDPPPDTDPHAYAALLLQRYENPSIRHRTWQIAMDGSQKLPQRILETIAESLARGQMPDGLILTVAAWMQYTSGATVEGAAIDVKDPLADRLRALWGDDVAQTVRGYLAMDEIFDAELAGNDAFYRALVAALKKLRADGMHMAADQSVPR